MPNNDKNNTFLDDLTNKLTSPYLAGILFILLALIVLIGTCIPQEPLVGKNALLEQYGESYEILRYWGVLDVFHSWWYIALLFLLSINLTLVSFIKVFPRAKKAFIWPKYIQKKPQNTQGWYELDSGLWDQLKDKLKNNGWSIKINDSNSSFVAIKGAYHRLGASVTHVGILLIMSGALISLLFGFNGIIQGIKGDQFILSDREDSKRSYILVQTSTVFHSPLWFGQSPEFEVEIGDSNRENYENGNPKQWTTNLKFLSNNGALLSKKEVSVNNPITFKGVDFYQADWKRILRGAFNENSFEINLDKIKGSEVSYVSPSHGLGLLFLISDKDPEKLNLISVNGQFRSDVLVSPNKLIESGLLRLLGSLMPNESLNIGPMNIKYIGAFEKTGIQYKSSPGDWLMIMGMCILVLGVLLAFGAKRTIWALREQKVLYLTATTDKAKELFKKEIKKLIHSINKEDTT